MKPVPTLAVFAAGLVVVFGGAVGVGRALGPVGSVADVPAASAGPAGTGLTAGTGATVGAAAPPVRGLAVSQDGFTLRLERSTLPAGRTAELAFHVEGPDGRPLARYELEHERELHLVVVRRDGSGFQHLHPVRDDAGRWSTRLAVDEPGPYKVFADFRPAGAPGPLTLASDLAVPGAYRPEPLPAEQRTARVDGYTVRVDGRLVAGTSSRLTLTVDRDGRPVRDLQPYLGAYGHLVALRDGDLAYLHVHPDGEGGGAAAGPGISFAADVPSEATYRLFLDFRHRDAVRTAALSLPAGPGPAAGPPPQHPAPAPDDDHGSGH